MMHKRAKRIMTAAVTALFVLSIGYFAVLPPTSAWFYQKYLGDEKTFVFGALNVGETYTQSANIELLAATKLEDPDEILFDDVIQVITVNAVNSGTFPARVYVTVNDNADLPNGLHYFFYEDGDTGVTVKDKIAGKNIITSGNNSATYTALKTYSLGTGGNDAGNYIVVLPGTNKDLKIAFWADYNAVGSTLENTNSVTEYATSSIPIKMSAVQNTDGAFTRN